MNKNIIKIIIATLCFIAILWFNPFAWNDATERTVVTRASGTQFVQFQPGLFYAGIYSKNTSYPNQISISYSKDEADWDLEDNNIDIGKISVRFNDPATALCEGIVQYILPNSEREMLAIHNAHINVEGLVRKRLAPYTQECLQSCAQLMNTEMHYSGGRAQMAQDYLDQLRNGVFLLNVKEINTFDSTENSYRKLYQVQKQYNDSGQIKRKYSSIKEYGVIVADAQITNVDYETAIDSLIGKKLAAATKASVSRQELMTAQQQAQTAEAQGKKELVTVEYDKKKEQTIQVVAAQTIVEVAKQDLIAQRVAAQAAIEEASKIKTLADAKAYEKARNLQADGALTQKLAAWTSSQEFWANAFAKYQGAIVPQMQMGGGNTTTNGAIDFMQLMGAKAARDLNLDLSNKK